MNDLFFGSSFFLPPSRSLSLSSFFFLIFTCSPLKYSIASLAKQVQC